MPSGGGGAVFIFSAEIGRKSTKNVRFCILTGPRPPPPPPLATLLHVNTWFPKSKPTNAIFMLGWIGKYLTSDLKCYCNCITSGLFVMIQKQKYGTMPPSKLVVILDLFKLSWHLVLKKRDIWDPLTVAEHEIELDFSAMSDLTNFKTAKILPCRAKLLRK